MCQSGANVGPDDPIVSFNRLGNADSATTASSTVVSSDNGKISVIFSVDQDDQHYLMCFKPADDYCTWWEPLKVFRAKADTHTFPTAIDVFDGSDLTSVTNPVLLQNFGFTLKMVLHTDAVAYVREGPLADGNTAWLKLSRFDFNKN